MSVGVVLSTQQLRVLVERRRRGVERLRRRVRIICEERVRGVVQVCVQFYRFQCTGRERDVRYAVVSRDEPVAGLFEAEARAAELP